MALASAREEQRHVASTQARAPPLVPLDVTMSQLQTLNKTGHNHYLRRSVLSPLAFLLSLLVSPASRKVLASSKPTHAHALQAQSMPPMPQCPNAQCVHVSCVCARHQLTSRVLLPLPVTRSLPQMVARGSRLPPPLARRLLLLSRIVYVYRGPMCGSISLAARSSTASQGCCAHSTQRLHTCIRG